MSHVIETIVHFRKYDLEYVQFLLGKSEVCQFFREVFSCSLRQSLIDMSLI